MKNFKNKYFVFLTVISLLLILAFMAQTATLDKHVTEADKIIGTWVSDARDSRMEIYKSGDTYKGRLQEGWGNRMVEADGKT